MDWLIWLSSGVGTGTYLFVGALFSRRHYVKVYTRYLRWKAEAPGTRARISWGSDVFDPPPKAIARKDVTYPEYMSSINRDIAPWLFIPLWLPILVLGRVYGFLHPRVELPYDLKIKELESELSRMDEEWTIGNGEDE